VISEGIRDEIRKEVAGTIAAFGLLALFFIAGFVVGWVIGKLT